MFVCQPYQLYLLCRICNPTTSCVGFVTSCIGFAIRYLRILAFVMRIKNPYIRIFRITNPKEPRISICNALYNAERIYPLSIIHYQLSIVN